MHGKGLTSPKSPQQELCQWVRVLQLFSSYSQGQ